MPDTIQDKNADKDAQRRFILSEEEMEIVQPQEDTNAS